MWQEMERKNMIKKIRDMNSALPGLLGGIVLFGVVSQNYQIYPVSVKNNICINGVLPDSVVLEAIEKVGLSERIKDINCLIGKEVDDNGIELSGGQLQRLAIARVIANKYPVVILDEPTSALDSITEQNINRLVMDALNDSGSTLIFISHKMSTTKLVDRILVFKDGKIIEDGNHNELMDKQGYYAKLYHEQNSMYKGLTG